MIVHQKMKSFRGKKHQCRYIRESCRSLKTKNWLHVCGFVVPQAFVHSSRKEMSDYSGLFVISRRIYTWSLWHYICNRVQSAARYNSFVQINNRIDSIVLATFCIWQMCQQKIQTEQYFYFHVSS